MHLLLLPPPEQDSLLSEKLVMLRDNLVVVVMQHTTCLAQLQQLNLAVAGMAYFIAADKKILSLARRHSFENAPEHLKNTSFQGTGRPHPAFFRP
jgi:hypothetical protein